MAGAHAMETTRTSKRSGAEMLILVKPSAHAAGMVKSSVCTLSAPAALNVAIPHSTACRMASVPGTLPPISSVSFRRLVSRGEGFRASAITWSTGFCADATASKNTGRRNNVFTDRIKLELEINSQKSAKRSRNSAELFLTQHLHCFKRYHSHNF